MDKRLRMDQVKRRHKESLGAALRPGFLLTESGMAALPDRKWEMENDEYSKRTGQYRIN